MQEDHDEQITVHGGISEPVRARTSTPSVDPRSYADAGQYVGQHSGHNGQDCPVAK